MGNLIKIPEDYASNTMYSKVKEAAQYIGEECIGLVMYHAGIDDVGPTPRPRCVCFNEVYTDTQQFDCPYCYGTTFAGGVKEAWRIWSIWDDDENPIERSKFGGFYDPHAFTVQTEPWPAFYEGDYLLRVSQWDTNKQAPVAFDGFYKTTNAAQITIRTGNRYGNSNSDQIAQKLKVVSQPDSAPINKYDVVENINFSRADVRVR